MGAPGEVMRSTLAAASGDATTPSGPAPAAGRAAAWAPWRRRATWIGGAMVLVASAATLVRSTSSREPAAPGPSGAPAPPGVVAPALATPRAAPEPPSAAPSTPPPGGAAPAPLTRGARHSAPARPVKARTATGYDPPTRSTRRVARSSSRSACDFVARRSRRARSGDPGGHRRGGCPPGARAGLRPRMHRGLHARPDGAPGRAGASSHRPHCVRPFPLCRSIVLR